MVVFLKTLDEKALNFVPPDRANSQVPFTDCNQNEHVKFALLDQLSEDKAVIFNKWRAAKYFLKDTKAKWKDLLLAVARFGLTERATVVVSQRKVIVEPLFDNQRVNDGKDDAFVLRVLCKELLVDLLEGLSEVFDGEIGAKKKFIHEIGDIRGIIIHWRLKKNTNFIKGSIQKKSLTSITNQMKINPKANQLFWECAN